MKRRAILIGLGALITLQAPTCLVFAGEKEAIATIKELAGHVLRSDFDPDQPPDVVAFWFRPALSDSELKKAASALEQLPGLRTLILDCTQVTDKGLAHLTGLTHLTELSLKATRITDAGLEHLEPLTSLKKVDLRLTAASQRGVVALRKTLPRAVIDHSRFEDLPTEAVRLRGRWRCISYQGVPVDPQAPIALPLSWPGTSWPRFETIWPSSMSVGSSSMRPRRRRPCDCS